MTVQELIKIDMHKVRRDSNLMSLYLKYFKEAFKYTPSCAGCSFSDDWYKLVRYYSKNKKESLTLQKAKVMSKIEIKKVQAKILSYQKDGRTYRLYDNILTQEFIKDYLTYGTKEELEQRRKLFRFPETEEQKETKEKKKDEVKINEEIVAKKPRRRKKKNG